MYDMHYDLLTILYFNFYGTSNKRNPKKVIEECRNIYNPSNIHGGFINLYFMSKNEMEEELGITNYPYNVLEMFKKSTDLIEQFKHNNIIDKNTDFIFSIEGCDYIQNEEELEDLYNMGLRSILLVWNNKNKYGSGNRSLDGLTNDGKSFLKKAIDLGIAIDLSHANSKTFDDMIDVIKEEQLNGKNVVALASHSNCRSLCDRQRNLTDEQLIKLKDIGGYIGLFSNRNFVSLNTDNESIEERKLKYLEHIDYVKKLGFSDDKILLSTDDMNFDLDTSYHGLQTFELDNVGTDLRNTLEKKYNKDFVDKIMFSNAKKLINKIKNNELDNNRKIGK